MVDEDVYISDPVLEAKMAGHWILDDERWASHAREHQLNAKAIDIAEAARIESVKVANENLKEYKAASNEFRGALKDQAANFVTQAEHDLWGARLTQLENARIARDVSDKVTAQQLSENRSRDREERSRQQWVIGVSVTIISVILSIVLNHVDLVK